MKALGLSLAVVTSASLAFASDADILWHFNSGGGNAQVAHAVINTSDGGFLLAGSTSSGSSAATDLLLLKLDASGIEEWSTRCGGDGFESAYGVVETNGGFTAVGYTSSFGAGDRDVYLVATDGSGRELWTATYGGIGAEVGRSLVPTADGLVILGTTDSFGAGENDLYLISTDSQGQAIWSTTFGGAIADDGRWISTRADGSLLLVGATGSFGNGNRNLYLVNADREGSELWSANFGGGSYFEWGSCGVETTTGDLFLLGSADIHGSELQEQYALLVTGAGIPHWIYRLGDGSFYDYGTACLASAGGQLVAAGTSKDPASLDNRPLLTVFAPDGRQLRRELLELPGRQWVDAITEVDDGYVLAGRSDDGSGPRAWAMKLSNLCPFFTAGTRSGQAPLTVEFTDQSVGDIVAWRWDFNGDGEVDSSEQNPSWTYGRGGSYSVTLEVVDANLERRVVMENLIRVEASPTEPRRSRGTRRP